MLKNIKYRLSPIAGAIILAVPTLAMADINMTNGNVSIVNGTPVININTPNVNGISSNDFSKMDIDSKGAVFNNSSADGQSILANKLGANPNLAAGGAKIILNQIKSNRASDLNGPMEVFGDKAKLIISNPSGITCSSCSFVGNTQDVTLTTGTPRLSFNQLYGYEVYNGDIVIKGSLSSNSPTAIIARAVQINGDVNVSGKNALTVIAGANSVSSDNQVTGSTSGAWRLNRYGIDVSSFGGMYADKITLVSTDKGVGVRNNGVITAGSAGLVLNANGNLINKSGNITSNENISITSNGEINNNSGKIIAAGDATLNTTLASISNQSGGVLSASKKMNINASSLNNTDGRIYATDDLSIDTNNQTLVNKGQAATAGIYGNKVTINSGEFNNQSGRVSAGSVNLSVKNLNVSQGEIDAINDINVYAKDYITNTEGRIRSDNGAVNLTAVNTIGNWNNKTLNITGDDAGGIISGLGGTTIRAKQLINGGQIVSNGDINISVTNDYRNYDQWPTTLLPLSEVTGIVKSGGSISITANDLSNRDSSITADKNIDITVTKSFDNRKGTLLAANGSINSFSKSLNNWRGLISSADMQLETTDYVNNNSGFITATNNLNLLSQGNIDNNFSNDFGSNESYKGQNGGIVGLNSTYIRSASLSSNDSRILAINGNLDINVAGDISNCNSTISSGTTMNLDSTSLNNNFGVIHSGDDMVVRTNKYSNLSNTLDINVMKTGTNTGTIISDSALRMDVNGNFINYSSIISKKDTDLRVYGNFTNYGYVNSQAGNAALDIHSVLSNFGEISAAYNLNLQLLPISTIENNSILKAGGTMNIDAGFLNNRTNGVISADKSMDIHNTKLTNYGNGRIIYPS